MFPKTDLKVLHTCKENLQEIYSKETVNDLCHYINEENRYNWFNSQCDIAGMT